MIIGENNRPQDLELNICKTKQLTNMRSAGAEELDTLQSPVDITLERALDLKRYKGNLENFLDFLRSLNQLLVFFLFIYFSHPY